MASFAAGRIRAEQAHSWRAVFRRGFEDWLKVEPLGDAPAVVLETANPAKFPEEIERMMGWAPDVPPRIAAMIKQPEDFDRMNVDYEQFKQYLIEREAKN